MADKCSLCKDKDREIRHLKHEIEFLKRIRSADKKEITRLRSLKDIGSNFTVTVKDGNITVKPLIEEED